MTITQEKAADFGLGLPPLPLTTSVDTDIILDQIATNSRRDLPRVGLFKSHARRLSVLGGGPSALETYGELGEVLVTVNASLQFALDKGLTPWACGVCDPNEHMIDLVPSVPDVFYFLASSCHPKLFEKLKDRQVILWHASGTPGMDPLIPPHDMQIGGGSTMGLRWINLAYVMGFRKFDLHGFDSSYSGDCTHAYPDRRDGKGGMDFEGYTTSIAFLTSCTAPTCRRSSMGGSFAATTARS